MAVIRLQRGQEAGSRGRLTRVRGRGQGGSGLSLLGLHTLQGRGARQANMGQANYKTGEVGCH